MRTVKKDLHKDLFAAKSGLIIHSSALCDGSNVYLFGGVSGSGKSSIAKKMNGLMIPVNDEKNVLQFTDRGITVSTYFTVDGSEEKQYLVNENVTGILAKVFFIRKVFNEPSRSEVISDKAQIWKMLLKCVAPPYFGEDHFFPNYLELIEKLIDSVPFFYFYFNISDNPEILADIMRKKC
ncbi:MAG TPA: hypothetical protein PL056_08970 [bacterium]|nr:hypothetical protein [bacterium]